VSNAAQDVVARNAHAIRERMAAAARRAGRDPAAVTLVAASKKQSPDAVRAALAAGIAVLGENRVQEAESKISAVGGGRWHMIGRLQRNKARRAVELFEMIHSVDTPPLAEALHRVAHEAGRAVPVLIEVNLAGESTKGGFAARELLPAVQQIALLDGLSLRGLMTVPPPADDAAASRPYFRQLAELAARVRELHGPAAGGELSMGMSDDFEIAIEEGSTMVRIGTALFGPRT
jgi:PLP dependent protein